METTGNPRCLARIQRGVTLIESAVATAVVAVAAGAVAPGLATLRAHQALAGAAAEFETDVAHVRSMAVSTGATWRISFESVAGKSCYVVHTGAAGDCTCLDGPQQACADGAQPLKRTIFATSSGPVAMSSNVRTMAFDGVKGTSTPAGTIRLTAPDGAAVHQVVNVMGRVRSCSPGRTVSAYKAC